ncbi:EamA family transporter [Spirulina sp. CS-785/01]|uniref:DMT family transporter n=1 Tax=Spirulina sp. CS-785/01 TaxID=3021716 RepID=UPI00232B0B05|nr:DMT family transporter [Spirulina sp. CS-785/01]MDB9315238.1 EamA family transporter [Spirulina sp. CS-785/01]
MGQLDQQPDQNPETAQENLQAITEELEQLKSSLVLQLHQEIDQLQNRKTRLLAETEQLELQRQEKAEQQHALAQQLAPVIAEQILEHLRDRLTQGSNAFEGSVSNGSLDNYNDNAYRLIASLDTTLRTTFKTLQQDLNSYQSSLSQQLGQMYNLEQQGEVLLDTLVDRLKAELQQDTVSSPSSPTVKPPTVRRPELPPPPKPPSQREGRPTKPPESQKSPQPPKRVSKSQIQLGFLLILLSSLALSFQNVVIKLILSSFALFPWLFGEQFTLGGYISPGFGNSILILCLRMVVVVPLMSVLAQFLYPNSWPDIRRFFQSGDKDAYWKVVGCGFFLFVSSVFIYMALGQLTPGVALTLFFVFPIVTVLMSWLFFGERPSWVRAVATVVVLGGVSLIQLASGGDTVSLSGAGVTFAILAGVTFAFHVLLIQACTKKLHPVPFSVLNFGVILLFSVLFLLLLMVAPLPTNMQIEVDPTMQVNILISGLVLGGLTLLSYLLNSIGITYIGAARASIIGATGPALTSIAALIVIGEGLTQGETWGMVLVTVGVLILNLERFFAPKAKPRQSQQNQK